MTRSGEVGEKVKGWREIVSLKGKKRRQSDTENIQTYVSVVHFCTEAACGRFCIWSEKVT